MQLLGVWKETNEGRREDSSEPLECLGKGVNRKVILYERKSLIEWDNKKVSLTNSRLHWDPLWLAITTISAIRIEEMAIGAAVTGRAPHDTDYFDTVKLRAQSYRNPTKL